uniref:enoyl-ACP reductase FabI n=1 Tax=Flavobacterium sp. TaxID=239 RepID=UPI00404A55F2
MVKEFHNQWGIILGGSSGLGLATANKLAKHGMNLCIVHRNGRAEIPEIEAEFELLRQENVKIINFNCDALNSMKQESCLQEIKELLHPKDQFSVLIHSLAKGTLKALSGENPLSLEDLKITTEAMSFSLYQWSQLILNAQLFTNDARIITFTSEGSQKPIPNYAAVSLAKASLEALVRSMAVEWSKFGIKTNAIQAGVTDTRALRQIPNAEIILKKSVNRNPQKRITTPEDVANATYLLCKKEAAWINGVVLKVDGGESLQ